MGEGTMEEELSAGEFEALTGLTPKALRLYAERGILSPTRVDPVTAYRSYDRAQVRHGVSLDLLRRARVPMAELAGAEGFDFAARRQTVAMERLLEDFHLDVAERIAAYDPADFVARRDLRPALDWIGVVIDLGVPDDLDGRFEAFGGLAVDVPAIDGALAEALAAVGTPPSDLVWTAVPEATRSGSGRMLIARPASTPLDPRTRDLLRARVRSRTGREVAVTAGTLPRRLEITFTDAGASAGEDDLGPVDEAALGHLHLLAFEHHRREHRLTAIQATPRQVVRGASLLDGPAPVSVFDALPPAGSRPPVAPA
jgi:DNA-binding transcriptional MerR regulator